VERKVSEILAARALDQPASTAPVDTISEEVQRRLDALERKIESGEKEDARSEGLRFLLMAKQHKERGEDSSALKMYELAEPFFPSQQKLQKKIEALKAKIAAKRELAAQGQKESQKLAAGTMLPPHAPSVPLQRSVEETKTKSKKGRAAPESDDEYNNSELPHDDQVTYNDGDDDSFTYKPSKARKPKSKPPAPPAFLSIPSDNGGGLTPRSKYLLSIVNSRDVTLIKGLSGVGAKKARDLVEFLELQGEDEGGKIESLKQLVGVPGMGCRTVEKMLEGVPAGL
jgi:hypothetical protein